MNTTSMRAFRDEFEKIGAELTPAARDKLPGKDFAVKAKSSNTGKEAYPIPDRQHARSALGFAKMHGDSSDLEAVRAKIHAKYPDMLKSAGDPSFLERLHPGTAGYHSDRMRAVLEGLSAKTYYPEKIAAVLDAVRGAMKGETAHHLTELAGLGVLGIPAADELQAHARASMAGDYGKEGVKSREVLPAVAKPMAEATGLGMLMGPEAHSLLSKLHGAGEGMVA